MTRTLSVEASCPPDPRAILARIDSRSLRGADAFETADAWPLGLTLLYLHELSARGVPIRYDGRDFAVRLMALSTAEEIELGLEVIARAAEIFDRAISPPDQTTPNRAAELERNLLASGAAEARALVRDRGTFAISAPVRAFHLGPRTLRSLEGAGPSADFAVRLREAVRRLQFIDPNEYFASGGVELATPEGLRAEVAIWAPGIDYLFPPLDFVRLATPDPGELLLVRAADLEALAGKRVAYLDERHALVRAIAESDWPAFLARARRLGSARGR